MAQPRVAGGSAHWSANRRNRCLGWNIPAESVLVKTLCLTIVDQGKTIQRRIETRVMVKVDKEWFWVFVRVER